MSIADEVSALLVRARRAPELAHVGNTRLARAVNAFVSARRPVADLVGYCLTYSDPTGEAAVRNVDRRAA